MLADTAPRHGTLKPTFVSIYQDAKPSAEFGMCNDFGNHIPYGAYLAAFSQTRIPVKWPNAAPNLEPLIHPRRSGPP
jgi:hypothetical protein